MKYQKGASYMAIITVVAIFLVVIILAYWPKDEYLSEGYTSENIWKSITSRKDDLTEKVKIEKWITDNLLNEYGDPADTVYAGGTPLFDETTGETMDKYDYIKQNHPSEPWNE